MMNSMISDLSGTAAYLDDVIVAGRSQQELREIGLTLLQPIQEHGFRLEVEKCEFFVPLLSTLDVSLLKMAVICKWYKITSI
ncbi:unnamed protein product [Hymenolepis diminuta]|uniref:Reverse transcriptase domain-containing protein n=1 Tax=Hymenolepis diminuta TaxID=6216 RepID=A0A0R3STY0_HYMDI|nr:unnamed protein product [Hymenolepis diminuta]